MRKLLFVFLFVCSAFAAFGQYGSKYGFFHPEYIGFPIDSNINQSLMWNHETARAEWLPLSGGGDSIIITSDSICVIYLGDTLCVGSNSDSFFLSGDTSLCVITMGDTLCSPYSAGGVTLYSGNGSFPEFAHRQVNMNQGFLTINRRAGYFAGGGNTRFGQYGTYPMFQINGGILPNDTSPAFEITPGFGADADLFTVYNGLTSAEDYSFGVARSTTLNPFVISEGTDLGGGTGRPIIELYGVGDSIVVANNLLAAGSAFRIRSHNTTAASSTQKALEVYLAGTNATAAQSTYAGHFSNLHGGSAPFNYAVYGINNSSLGAAVSGNNAVGGRAIEGICSAGAGTAVYASAFAGLAFNGLTQASTGCAKFSSIPSSTTGSCTILSLTRETTGTATDGIEAQLPIGIETSTGAIQNANVWSHQWSTADNSTRHSKVILYGVTNGTQGALFTVEGDGRFLFNGRSQNKLGAAVAAANDLTLGYDGNVFHITGATQINAITTTGWQAGSEITLIFDSTPLVKSTTAGGGSTALLNLASGVDFAATAKDVLKLLYDGSEWFEVSRSAN